MSEDQAEPPENSSYSKTFEEMFPYYLSIGMTYDQYWNGEPWLVRSYRKAEELKNARDNQKMWLQGMYIYDAIARISPILHDFAKQGTKAEPYTPKPYPITPAELREEKREKEMAVQKRGKALLERLMAQQREESNENGTDKSHLARGA